MPPQWTAADRILHTAQLYRAGKVRRILWTRVRLIFLNHSATSQMLSGLAFALAKPGRSVVSSYRMSKPRGTGCGRLLGLSLGPHGSTGQPSRLGVTRFGPFRSRCLPHECEVDGANCANIRSVDHLKCGPVNSLERWRVVCS
jgi:hypothetical protein